MCIRDRAKIDYFRDAPNGGDLNVSYALGLGLNACTDETYLAARVLRLVTLGSLEPELEPGKKKDVYKRQAGTCSARSTSSISSAKRPPRSMPLSPWSSCTWAP